MLPAINNRILATDGQTRLPRYDKGPGEAQLSLPPDVQARLAGLGQARPNVSPAQGTRLFEGAVHNNQSFAEWRTNHRESPRNAVRARPLLQEPAQATRYWRENGGDVLDPQQVQIPEAQRPDFSRPPRLTYQTDTAVAGRVDAEVFTSRDGTLDYTIFRDAEGHAWVANVGEAGADINSHGVRTQSVDPGELTTPRWEYHEQIPPRFQGARHPEHRCAGKLLRQ